MAGLAGWTALDVVSGALSLGVLAGIVPLGIYLSSLADWSGDTNVGSRLRASAWCITVCGTLVLAALLLILLPVPLQGLFGVAAIVLSIIVAVGFVLFCVSVVQLALTSVWAIQNSYEAREREIRIEERKRRDAEAHGTRAQMADAASEDDGARAEARRTKPCRECGYDLTGLPGAYEGGGVCPECGTRFEKLEVYKPEYTEDATIPDAIPLAGDEEEPAADRPGEQAEREHAEEPRDERRKRELDPYELAPDDET
jgi:membrane protein implicated in regulation of membrane protease activity